MRKLRPLIIIVFLIAAVTVISGCSKTTLNGKDIALYTIVYPEYGNEYEHRAAEYLQSVIKERTGLELPVVSDGEKQVKNEILIGDTDRELSNTAKKTDRNDFEYVIIADKDSIALAGRYFLIAGAAYAFAEKYIPGNEFKSLVSAEAQILTPQPEKPKNLFLLIGDGMGPMQTKLIEYEDYTGNEDIEDRFFGYYFPNHGESMTDSLSGITDSAAGGTALATGFKTVNGYVGRDKDLKDLLSLTELASSKGKKTAVMSTDVATGATPASFSAHADDRNDSDAIAESQKKLKDTVILCGLNTETDESIIKKLTDTVNALENENGFFMMYEEGYIDKHCHNNEADKALLTVLRFDKVIGTVMEYALYNPDTAVIITADHETGGLTLEGNSLKYTSTGHTGTNVPIFAYGLGTEIFNGEAVNNTEISKYFAAMMGDTSFGD